MESSAPRTTETQAVAASNSAADRYDGLRSYLAGLSIDQYHVELPFAQIEELIGSPLPAEASEYDWWRVDGNGSPTPQSRAWVNAGFGIGCIAGLGDKAGWVSLVRGLQRWPGVGVASTEFGQLPVAERLRQLAIGYLESGKLLCTHLGENPAELTWPRGSVVCFCYRHAIELFVKACILHREPIAKCDHNISNLRKQYFKLYPEAKFAFQTLYDISVEDLEELFGRPVVDIEEFEKKEDQVYRYFSDKQGRSPKGQHMFGPGAWLSMLDQLERDINRIWKLIRAS
jgi:hypothetical protein